MKIFPLFGLSHLFQSLASEHILYRYDSGALSREIFHSVGFFHRFGNNGLCFSCAYYDGERRIKGPGTIQKKPLKKEQYIVKTGSF